MQTVEELLLEALDQIGAKNPKAAEVIHKSDVSDEEKLVLAQNVISGKFQESVPAWRRPKGESKPEPEHIVELRESLSVQRSYVRKNNGAIHNYSGNTETGDKQKLVEAGIGLGLSRKEAEVFAEVDDDDRDFASLLKEN